MADRNIDLAQQIIDLTLALGADSADAIVGGASLSLSCRKGELEDDERAESRDLGLRAIIGQKQAFVSGTAVDKDALARLAERAVDMARTAPDDPFCGLADAAQLATEFPALDLADSHEPSAEQLLNMALETEAAALAHDGITNTEGLAQAGDAAPPRLSPAMALPAVMKAPAFH